MIDFSIAREESVGGGSFFIEQHGHRVAELTYRRDHATTLVIEHVEVEPELRGRGLGNRLIGAAVAWARQTGTSLRPACSYAAAEFQRDESIRDVLA